MKFSLDNLRGRLGASGEELAARRMKKLGFAVVDRNWRCHAGEIDLVARKGPLLVFVEVKTRKSDRFGPPQNAVTARKKAKIEQLAGIYVKTKKLEDLKVRFDVIAIRWNEGGGSDMEHIEAAFTTSR